MKILASITVSLLLAGPVMAASDAARIAGDLKTNGILFSQDGSKLYSAKDLLKNRGMWNSTTLYSAGDVVQTTSGSYVCTQAHTNFLPPNASYWSVLSIQGTQGPKGDTGPIGPAGPTGPAGSISDYERKSICDLYAVINSKGSGTQTSPNPLPLPTFCGIGNCTVSNWSDCSCATGTMVRTRSIIIPAYNGGATCPPLEDTLACTARQCYVPSISTVITSPTAVGTVSIAGSSNPIICGIDLKISYPIGVRAVASGTASGSWIPNEINGLTTFSIVNTQAFGPGVVATINYANVPAGSTAADFDVTLLKVFDCDGALIQ